MEPFPFLRESKNLTADHADRMGFPLIFLEIVERSRPRLCGSALVGSSY
jgi:hypothetical protein